MPNTREKLIELLHDAPIVKCTLGWQYSKRILTRMSEYLIANGVTVQAWIPVTERLPQKKGEICKNVNLLMDDGIVTAGWLNEDTGKAYYLDPRNDFVSKVPISRATHWKEIK